MSDHHAPEIAECESGSGEGSAVHMYVVPDESASVSAALTFERSQNGSAKDINGSTDGSTVLVEDQDEPTSRFVSIASHPEFAALMASHREQFEFQKREMMESVKQDILSTNSMYRLQKDTYSLLLTSDYRTTMFFAAIFVWSVAIALYILAIISIIDFDSNPDNPLNIPAGVEVSVTLAQFLLLGIAVLVQDSLREGIFVVENYQKLMESIPELTKTKICICFVTKLVETLLSLFFILILICQSEDVVDLLKDFTALLFISSLDNVLFKVGEEGYLGGQFKEAAAETQSYRFKPSGGSKQKTIIRFTVMTTVYLSMLGSWIVLCPIRQSNGYYLVDTVAVQFPHSSDETLQYFTGLYKRQGSHDRRVRYVETNAALGSQTNTTFWRRTQEVTPRYPAYFAYCVNLRAWVFVTKSGDESPCSDYQAISEEYAGYDLSETGSLTWYLNDGTDRREPLQEFFFREYYNKEPDFETDERFGLFGEFDLPCTTLHLDELKGRFVTTREFASRYSLLLDEGGNILKVYKRPVYYNSDSRDLILFTGSAWILTGATFLHDYDQSSDLANYLANHFHAYWSNYKTFLITGAIVFSSKDDGATPIGLTWHPFNSLTRTADETQTVEATLLCAICDEEKNPCFYEGECQDDGSCSCRTGSSGVLCQVPPNGDGLCNPFFNNLAFAWDGGDCCKATCHSTESFLCGLDETKRFHREFVMCQDPGTSLECQQSSDECWKPSGDSIFGESNNAESGFSISTFESILVVGEPGANSVRVFDRYGAEYIYRDSLPSAGGQTRFGSSVSVSASKYIRGSPAGPSRPVIAAAGGGKLFVYQWSNENVWEDVSPEMVLFDVADPALLSTGVYQEGKTVAAFEYSVDGLNGRATVWRRQSRDSRHWEVSGNITCNCSDFSLSADGTHLVAAHSAEESATLHLFDADTNSFEEMGVVELGVVSRSFQLSEDGTVLAVLGVRDGDEYKQELCLLDRAIDGDIYAKRKVCTRSVQISTVMKDSIEVNADGSMVTLALKERNTIKTFRYHDSGIWDEFEEELSGFSVSMVSDAELIVGQPLDDTVGSNRGKVSIYGRNAVVCNPDEVLMEVSVVLDDHPEHTWWQLYDNTEEVVFAQNGPYDPVDANLAVHHGDMCVSKEHCLTLLVYDTQGNGISCEYSVAADGRPLLFNLSDQGLVDFVDVGPGDGCVASDKLPAMDLLQTPLFTRCSHKTCDWAPTGNELWGLEDNERFGTRASISHDGSLLAASSIQSDPGGGLSGSKGHVRAFAESKNNNSWIQLGQDMNGFGTEHTFGEALALAGDAEVIIFGSPPVATWSGVFGFAEVFEHLGTEWIQKGRTLKGVAGDPFASNVAISDDGDIIAIASKPKYLPRLDASAGFVRMYAFDRDASDWIQQGNETFLGDGWADECGDGMAMSGNGKVFAFGCKIAFDVPRVVRVFEYDETNEVFRQLGSDEIRGLDQWDGFGTSRPGTTSSDWMYGDAISLSRDGLTLAAGSLYSLPQFLTVIFPDLIRVSYVKVWRYNPATNTWNRLGQTIQEKAEDAAGIVSLSSDGRVLVVGAPGTGADDIGDGVGRVRVYYFADSIDTWCQIGGGISGSAREGLFGNSVSLTSDGLRFAAAEFGIDGPGAMLAGRVRVLDLLPTPDPIDEGPLGEEVGCDVGYFSFRVDLLLDLYPEDTSYTIRDSKSAVVASSSFENALPGDRHTATYCFPDSAFALRFDIDDKFEDGLCCDNGDGGFQLFKDGELVLEGGDFNSSVSLCLSPGYAAVDVLFTEQGSSSRFENRLLLLQSDGSETNLLSYHHQNDLDKNAWSSDLCVPNGCLVFLVENSNDFWVSISHEGSIEFDTRGSLFNMGSYDFQAFWFGECQERLCPTSDLVKLSIKHMERGSTYQVRWSLFDGSAALLWDLESATLPEATNHWACAPHNTCLAFRVDFDITDDAQGYSSWTGGYSVWLNEELKADYHFAYTRYPKFHQFGSCQLSCGEGEALLRIHVTTGTITRDPPGVFFWDTTYSVWSLFGSDPEAVITHGYTLPDSDKEFEYRFCLPANDLHLFHFKGDAAEYQVFWDDATLDVSNGFAEFGQTKQCSQGDFAVNIFVETDDTLPDEMFWALLDVRNGTTLLSVDGYNPAQKRRLLHHATCMSDLCGHFEWYGDPAYKTEKLQVFVEDTLVTGVGESQLGGGKSFFELPFCLQTYSPTGAPALRPAGCGDNIINGSEVCDGTADSGMSCGDFDAFLADSGEIGCLWDCSGADTTRCHKIVLEEMNLTESVGNSFEGSVNVSHAIGLITFEMMGGTGDADLYVRHGSPPVPAAYLFDCAPHQTGNIEQCSSEEGPDMIVAQQGVYHFAVVAYEDFSGVSLRVFVDGVQVSNNGTRTTST